VLGHDAVLGQRAWDAAAGIEITLCNTPMARLPDLLPGGADHALIDWLVSRHAQTELQVQLVLQMDSRSMTEWPSLGSARLGWNSWLTAGPGAPEGATLRPIVTRLKRTQAAQIN
jgi:type VI secretion system protein ImpH